MKIFYKEFEDFCDYDKNFTEKLNFVFSVCYSSTIKIYCIKYLYFSLSFQNETCIFLSFWDFIIVDFYVMRNYHGDKRIIYNVKNKKLIKNISL